MLSQEAFCARFATEFEIDDVEGLEVRLIVDDLLFDSFQLFRVALLLESLLPTFEIPDQLAIEDIRVGDLYYYYSMEFERQDVGGTNRE